MIYLNYNYYAKIMAVKHFVVIILTDVHLQHKSVETEIDGGESRLAKTRVAERHNRYDKYIQDKSEEVNLAIIFLTLLPFS